MKEKKANDDIAIKYVIRKIEADDSEEKTESFINIALEPVEKPKIPEQPLNLFSELTGLLGEEEDVEKSRKFAEDMMKKAMLSQSLYHITVTQVQWKKLGKTIGDTVTLSIQ